MKVRLLLKAKEPVNGYNAGHEMTLFNEIFHPGVGLAYFPLDKAWEILRIDQFISSRKDMDFYENDKVLVRGTKKVGDYETTIIKTNQGFTLAENKTMFNNDMCFVAILDVL